MSVVVTVGISAESLLAAGTNGPWQRRFCVWCAAGTRSTSLARISFGRKGQLPLPNWRRPKGVLPLRNQHPLVILHGHRVLKRPEVKTSQMNRPAMRTPHVSLVAKRDTSLAGQKNTRTEMTFPAVPPQVIADGIGPAATKILR